MQSARPITVHRAGFLFLCFFLFTGNFLQAQENSPYTRFGLGDLLPSQNILNRSMGGLSIPYSDLQAVNFINPASYAYLKVTTLDVGIEFNQRAIRSDDPVRKYTSRYLIPTYLNLGIPLKKKGQWGMNIGLRPISRINYNLVSATRIQNIDSVVYNYTGTGGSYQAFIGTGFGTKKFSFGINAGYLFGNKLYSSKMILLNDSIPYRKANASDTTRFGGLFLNAGLLYKIQVGNKSSLRLGANGSLQNNLKATRDISRETFEFNPTAGTNVIDSVYRGVSDKGTIVYPGSFGFGAMLEIEDKWAIGAEYSQTLWSNYRYYEKPDQLKNSWTLRIGGQFQPDINGRSYWSRVVYRAGFSYGADPVAIAPAFNQYLFSAGLALPVRRNFYTNQYTTINVALEAGARGNKDIAVRESLFRVALGLNLSDIWFNPRKYD